MDLLQQCGYARKRNASFQILAGIFHRLSFSLCVAQPHLWFCGYLGASTAVELRAASSSISVELLISITPLWQSPAPASLKLGIVAFLERKASPAIAGERIQSANGLTDADFQFLRDLQAQNFSIACSEGGRRRTG